MAWWQRVCVGWLLVFATSSAANPAASMQAPLRISLECDGAGQTNACPTLIRGLLEESAWFLLSPRSNNDITLYVTQTPVGTDDRLHVRVVSSMKGPPSTYEFLATLNTRQDDDGLRSSLRPILWRALLPYLAERHPTAIKLSLDAPPTNIVATEQTPWGITLSVHGFGSWTGDYRNYNESTTAWLTRTTPTCVGWLGGGAYHSRSVQPPLEVDGTLISLDSSSWGAWVQGAHVRVLSPHVSVMLSGTGNWNDPYGHQRLFATSAVGVSWDMFAPDDPRGNQLAVAYLLGGTAEKYNRTNVLGEDHAVFPDHAFIGVASLRRDKVRYSAALVGSSQLLHPTRRYELKLQGGISMQLGDHVDVGFDVSATKRALPGPLNFDPSNPDEVSRLSYAEPFSLNASLSVSVHWDATNGVTNNRFAYTK